MPTRQGDTRIAALTSRVFASHFGHLSLIFAWIGGLFIAGARFSNYVAWLDRPAVYRPGARCRHFGPVLDSDLRRCLDRWTYLPLCVCVWAIAVFPTMLLVTYLKVVCSSRTRSSPHCSRIADGTKGSVSSWIPTPYILALLRQVALEPWALYNRGVCYVPELDVDDHDCCIRPPWV